MKHYILDKRLVHGAVILLMLETVLIMIIGANNVSTTNANRDLETAIGTQKAKARYWEGRFKELRESGMCLERDPKMEAL